ncbi:MAG: chromosome segregation protein SMC [Clostridiales bacterium]|jgi:chromosome segregation protein|nr:chromosome segregation protein SMC [Clostridiales bacterium]
MNFSKIEMQGFKSFADRTKIEFDSEVTAIVGPNGCGKSNVADAVRWVLGEQSAKTLRGKSMQDVIFNGTENRKSTSYCEVSLFFDNGNRQFGIDFDELVLTRKLDRSGDSEYLINGNNCRLKDIVDLLRDTGAGREGYSIIGQGKIDEILSAKPDDRRNIFEEAAGIAKSKSKKIEAERRLVRARENLSRHEDIMGELFRQIEPLRKQSDDAMRCRELKDELRFNEVNAYIYQYENNEREKDEINRKILETEERLTAERNAYNELTAAFNERMDGINGADKKIADCREELTAHLVEAEKNAGELKVFGERLSNLRAGGSRINGELAALRNSVADKKKALAEAEARAEVLKEKNLAAAERLRLVSDELAALKANLSERERAAEENDRSVIENIGRLAEIKSNMSQLIKEEEMLKESRVTALNGLDELRASAEALGRERAATEKEAAAVGEAVKNTAKDVERLEREYTEKRIKIGRGREESKNLTQRIAALETRARMLDEIKNEYEGYVYPVKKLMTDGKSDKNLKERILGVVAEVIKVEEKYEQAVDTALGAALQHIIVGDEDDAKSLIAYLKDKRYGRATFLPLTSVKARLLEKEYEGIMKIPGCFGVASELIGCDVKFRGIIRNLLGRTVVADNIDTAAGIAKRYNYAFRIVTLDGDIFMPSGAITGGSRKSDSNADIISRDRSIAQTATALSKSRGQNEMLDKALKIAERESESISVDIKKRGDVLKKNEIAHAALAERLEKVSSRTDAVLSEIRGIEARLAATDARLSEIRRDIESVDRLGEDTVNRRKSIEELREESRRGMNEKRGERERLENAATDARVALTEGQKDAEALRESIAALSRGLNADVLKIAELEGALARLAATIAEQEEKAAFEAMSGEERLRIEELKAVLEGLDEYKEECRRELSELEDRRGKKAEEISALGERKVREESAAERIEAESRVLEEKVRDEYGLDYASALPLRAAEYDYRKSLTLIGRLKKKIDDLGDVNMLAVKEYEEVGERYNCMIVQRDDMQRAESDLVGIINDLTREMNAKFKSEFDKINENFMAIFKQLFNGGKAKLQLEESGDKDVLNAGIEIYAEPPGKKLQHISLLSGGEKALTAIAILFAILKLKPMPFCVLDEIEAALDDANANLFAEYLKKFSKNTQFIVITHRKPTMELADTLYGVTMEEKGVSKLVSVQLSEAVKNAERAV